MQDLLVRVRRTHVEAAALHVAAASAVRSAVSTVSSVAARHGSLLRSHHADPVARRAAVAGWPEPVTRVFTSAGLRPLRQLVGDVAYRAGVAEADVPSFVLAVQELMTNAIWHGGGWGRVRMHREGHLLLCVVTDRGPGMTDGPEHHGNLPDIASQGGRGLFLARKMTDGLRIRTGATGVTATVTMRLPHPAPDPLPRAVA